MMCYLSIMLKYHPDKNYNSEESTHISKALLAFSPFGLLAFWRASFSKEVRAGLTGTQEHQALEFAPQGQAGPS
jgi:hypothetical protein